MMRDSGSGCPGQPDGDQSSMRLFIALLFDEATVDRLVDVQTRLRALVSGGNFSRRENLHLTLEFLGEVEKSSMRSVCEAMDETEVEPLQLRFDQVGFFPGGRRGDHGGCIGTSERGPRAAHDEGDTWWVGVDGGAGLRRLQRELAANLAERGFELQKRTFLPHITLARQVRYRRPVPEGAGATARPEAGRILGQTSRTEVSAISLMESSRIAGTLTYTERYRSEAKPQDGKTTRS